MTTARNIAASVLVVIGTVFFAAPLRAARIEVGRQSWDIFTFKIANGSISEPYIVFWRWSDGTVSGDQQPTHRFPGAGDYRAQAELTDVHGQTVKVEQAVSISFFHPRNWKAWGVVGILSVILLSSILFTLRRRGG